MTFFWTDHGNIPLVHVRNIFFNEYKVLKNRVWCGFYIMAVVIFMTHACLGWGKLTLAPSSGIPQEASVLCQVLRVPHFLGDRFDVHSFPSFRDPYTMREHRVSDMESTTAGPRSPKSLTRREWPPKQE